MVRLAHSRFIVGLDTFTVILMNLLGDIIGEFGIKVEIFVQYRW